MKIRALWLVLIFLVSALGVWLFSGHGVRADGEARGATVIAMTGDYQTGWAPSTLTVTRGEKVTLKIRSDDYQHQLVIPDLGVTSPVVSPDNPAEVTFVPEKVGDFPFHCAFHAAMTGVLKVEEAR